jgi:hypothetical protein
MKKHLCLFLAPCVLASSAWGRVDVVSHDVTLSQSLGTTTFSITFNQPLDLSTFDEYGRAARYFQVFVFGDPGKVYPENYSAIIRSAEDANTGSNVVVRAPKPLNQTERNDPVADGWGRTLATAPILTQGNTATFTLNNQDFNFFGNQGFRYSIEAYEYDGYWGGTEPTWAKVIPIPEAGTGLQFMLGAAFMVAALRRMKAPKAVATLAQ